MTKTNTKQDKLPKVRKHITMSGTLWQGINIYRQSVNGADYEDERDISAFVCRAISEKLDKLGIKWK